MSNTPRNNEKTTAEFRLAMLEKLNENNHKKHWNEASVRWLSNRLYDELIELNIDLSQLGDQPKIAIQSAMKECADVANMAMMVWDNLKNGIIEGSSDTDYLEPGRDEL